MLELDRQHRRVVPVMHTIWSDRRAAVTVAAVACCVLVAAATAAAIPWPDGPASSEQADPTDGIETLDEPVLTSASLDRDHGAAHHGMERQAAHSSLMQGTTPPGSTTQGQLVGIALALVVLALIGAVVWGVRPNVVGRFGRSSIGGGKPRSVDNRSTGRSAEEELLTDEERIIGLLEENGGRLKQQHVVETTDWSKAKVSRLLSSMEDSDTIVRIQLGREKLIFLSGHEPSGARSSLGEDR